MGATTTDGSCAAVLCLENSICENGQCYLICPAGFKDCNGRFDDGCEANVKEGDVENCGNCGAKCRPPKSYEFVNCVDGKCKYTDKCAAIKCATFPNSSTTCSKGQCRVTCNPGYANCNDVYEVGVDGCEVHLLSDVNNCGKCGLKCLKPTCRYGNCICCFIILVLVHVSCCLLSQAFKCRD